MKLPFFRAKEAEAPRKRAAAAPVVAGPVEVARTQARRRMVGALVLLAAGVIGFPLLFETQPRPLPVDTPMLLPEGGAARAVGPSPVRSLPSLPADAGIEGSAGAASAPLRADSAVQSVVIGAASATQAAAPEAQTAAPRVPAVALAKTEAKAAGKPLAAPAIAAEAAPRFVVQVGAYYDKEHERAARLRLEKLGLKSYTQDVDTPSGKRTRVRVGPFASRQEAESVAGKIKASGMQADLLSL